MNKNYELTLLVRPDISDEEVKMALQQLKDIIISNNGSVLYAEYWGLRKLEYKINKNDNAFFYMLQINSNKEINDLLEEKINTSAIFIRHLLLNINKDEVKVKTANNLINGNDLDDGIVFDRRYYNVIGNVFNLG